MKATRILIAAGAAGLTIAGSAAMATATGDGPVARCVDATYATDGEVTLAEVQSSLPSGAQRVVRVVNEVLPELRVEGDPLCADVQGTSVEFDNGTLMLLPPGAQAVRIEDGYLVASFNAES